MGLPRCFAESVKSLKFFDFCWVVSPHRRFDILSGVFLCFVFRRLIEWAELRSTTWTRLDESTEPNSALCFAVAQMITNGQFLSKARRARGLWGVMGGLECGMSAAWGVSEECYIGEPRVLFLLHVGPRNLEAAGVLAILSFIVCNAVQGYSRQLRPSTLPVSG